MKIWDGSEAEGVELTVKGKKALEDAHVGCSIAVNGVCLTATSFDTEKVGTNFSTMLFCLSKLTIRCV